MAERFAMAETPMTSARYHSGRDIPSVSGAAPGESLVKEARDRAQAAWEYDRENREDGFIDLRFLAGDQWPANIRIAREGAGRPTVTINKLPQFVYQVANDIRTNPPGIKVVPSNGDKHNKQTADIYAGLIRSIENASGGPDIYAQAGGQAVACGQGNWRVNTRYVSDDVFDQEVVLESIRHPFSVLWDPEAMRPDRSDAEWCQVTQLIHKDSFKIKHPGASAASFDTPIPGQDPEAGLFWRNGDFIRLIEYWRKVDVKKKLMQFASGEVIDATELKRAQIEALSAELGEVVRERDVEAKKVRSSLLSAVDILEDEEDWLGVHIPIITTIGGEIPLDTKVVRFGLIRFARDAQQLYNYARSAAAESIGLAPKSPYLLTSKMISRWVDMWNTHNTTQRPYLVYDPDDAAPLGPTRLHPPETPQAFYQEQQIASEDMKGTTGIYDASLGARSNETSGVAINARDRQGDTATAHYTSNLTTSMMHCGRVMIDLIPKIYDTQRIIRILGEDETEDFVPINHVVMSDRGEPVLMNDLSEGRYDVRPRPGPSYTTKRLEAADSMLAFTQAVPGSAAVIADLIAKNQDWPGADEIAERLRRTIPPHILGDDQEGDKDNPQAAQARQAQAMQAQFATMMQQLALMKAEGDLAKVRADTEKSHTAALNSKIDALLKALQAGLPPAVLAGEAGMMPDMPSPGGQMQPQPQPEPPMGAPGAGQGGGQNALAGDMGQGGQMPPAGPSGPPMASPGGAPMQPEGAPPIDLPTGGLHEFLGGAGGNQLH